MAGKSLTGHKESAVNRKRVIAYIICYGENRQGEAVREIEVQRDDENDVRSIRRYRNMPSRRVRIEIAAIETWGKRGLTG